jgi:hypothetical protein
VKLRKVCILRYNIEPKPQLYDYKVQVWLESVTVTEEYRQWGTITYWQIQKIHSKNTDYIGA